MISILLQLAIYLGLGAAAAYFLTSTNNGFLVVMILVAVVLWWLALLYRTDGLGLVFRFLLGRPGGDR